MQIMNGNLKDFRKKYLFKLHDDRHNDRHADRHNDMHKDLLLVFKIIRQVCIYLNRLIARGYIYMDLKLENILYKLKK